MNTVDSGDTDDCSIFDFNLRVDVGAGWQCTVSYINNGCYYIVGLPLGILLGFVFDIGAMGEVQYFIGVQLYGSQHEEPLHNCIPEATSTESAKLVFYYLIVLLVHSQLKETAENVDEAVREFPDANKKPEDLWKNHSKVVHPKSHRKNIPSWSAIQKILDSGEVIGLKHFKPMKPLGSGDTGREKCSILLGCN